MTLVEFESEYYDLVSAVLSAGYKHYAMRLHDLLDFLATSEISRERMRTLEGSVDFDEWYGAAKRASGLVGTGDLDWARDRTTRLAQTLGLFRSFAADDSAFMDFSINFLYAGSRYDDMIYKINSELFEPFSRDLLKDIVRTHEQTGNVQVPASDRIVSLDHNNASYQELMTKLTQIHRTVESSNELAASSPEEKDRVVAELDAGQRLLRALTVRAETVWNVLQPALKWIREKTTDSMVGIAVAAIVAMLAGLLGIVIPGL